MEQELFADSYSRKKVKLAVIAGASEALKSKSNNPKKQDNDILQEITDHIDNIINNID